MLPGLSSWRPVSELRHSKPFGFIVTNPPYGERIEEKENLPALYREIGESYKSLDRWSMYLITAYDKAENDIGRKGTLSPVHHRWIFHWKGRSARTGMRFSFFVAHTGHRLLFSESRRSKALLYSVPDMRSSFRHSRSAP